MPALKNPRREKFAQACAAGQGAVEAYVAAGFQPNEKRARALFADQDILSRIAEIQAPADAKVPRRYYGFTHGTYFDSSAWFHTYEAAVRYATFLGWEESRVESMMECPIDVPEDDLMDTPEKAWQ